MSRTPVVMSLILLLLAGCAAVPSRIDPPGVSLADLRPQGFTLLEQTYLLTLRVQNPNDFDIPIDGLSYRLEVNDEELASGVSSQSVTLPRFGSALIEVEAVSSLAGLFRQIIALQQEGKGGVLRYRLVGKISGGKLWPSVPFDHRSELRLPGARKETPSP